LSKPVILGVSGARLTRDEAALLLKHRPRGVILFSRNIENPAQLAALVAALREVLPPDGLLMVDQEGGRVARMRKPFWHEFPPAGALRRGNDAYARGRAIGAMVKAAGFDVTAAPVLDLRHEGASDVIGNRAFTGDAAQVAMMGARMARGLMLEGVIPVMKHIPGHGRALVDSHHALPRVGPVDVTADFYPFAANNALPWAMTAHIIYEAYDPVWPATLSKIVIERVIRGKIGFAGVLVSDDLAMHALSGTPAERAVAALAAGCDIALYCPGDMAGNVSILEAVRHG
jgi:beta-N-acetylhexosaminidase